MREEDIIEVIPVGEDETYDIEVEHEEHSFFANDISVSNSHAISYSIISFQCAYLLTYHEPEWLCAFLNEEPEKSKNDAISAVKNLGYEIKKVDINVSEEQWGTVRDKTKVLVQPLSSIKGLGDTAIQQIIANRPFNSIEQLLFNDNISYQKLNKKHLDVLVRSGACNSLMDARFKHLRHFWLSTVFNRPRTREALATNIRVYNNEPDFSHEEKIKNELELNGVFPMHLVMNDKLKVKLKIKNYKSISEFNEESQQLVWFIPTTKELKYTKNNRLYWELHVTDGIRENIKIKCWNVDQDDTVFFYRPYLSLLQYSEDYGFSLTNPNRSMKLIG